MGIPPPHTLPWWVLSRRSHLRRTRRTSGRRPRTRGTPRCSNSTGTLGRPRTRPRRSHPPPRVICACHSLSSDHGAQSRSSEATHPRIVTTFPAFLGFLVNRHVGRERRVVRVPRIERTNLALGSCFCSRRSSPQRAWDHLRFQVRRIEADFRLPRPALPLGLERAWERVVGSWVSSQSRHSP
jgi:hypothetical protein